MEVFGNNGNEIKQKKNGFFCCEKCEYITDRKNNMDNHCLSAKHLKGQNGNNFKQKLSNIFTCKWCCKNYHTSAGLWKHKKKCKINNETQDETFSDITDKDELIMMLIKQNSELIKEQTKEIDQAIAAHKKKRGIKGKKELDEEQEMRDILFRAGFRKDNKSEAQRNLEKEAATTLGKAFKENKARKEVRKLFEEAYIDKIDADNREIKKQEEQAEEQAGKVITKAAQKYQAMKKKKALEKRIKQALEAEIASLQEEMKGGSRPQKEPKSSVKSKAISKAFESVTDFWLADTTKEAAKQAKKDARQAKKDAQKDTEDKLSARAKALQERRKLLEAQAK
jgi:hypothetical protein